MGRIQRSAVANSATAPTTHASGAVGDGQPVEAERSPGIHDENPHPIVAADYHLLSAAIDASVSRNRNGVGQRDSPAAHEGYCPAASQCGQQMGFVADGNDDACLCAWRRQGERQQDEDQ